MFWFIFLSVHFTWFLSALKHVKVLMLWTNEDGQHSQEASEFLHWNWKLTDCTYFIHAMLNPVIPSVFLKKQKDFQDKISFSFFLFQENWMLSRLFFLFLRDVHQFVSTSSVAHWNSTAEFLSWKGKHKNSNDTSMCFPSSEYRAEVCVSMHYQIKALDKM